jgi:hypothetical protein
MKLWHVAVSWAMLTVAADASQPGPPAAGDADYRPITAAAHELERQLDFMLRALATIPGPPKGRGLYKDLNLVHADLTVFQQKVQKKTSREDLRVAYDKMEERLGSFLEEVEAFEKWDKAIRLVARRARAADSDLHFALFGGDPAMSRGAQALYRHTLAARARLEGLEDELRYLFQGAQSLQLWLPDLKATRGALAEFQRLQKAQAERAELQKQFKDLDGIWEKLVERFKALPERNYLRLLSDAAHVDRVLDRLARLIGIVGRRLPMRDPLAF